MDHVIKDEDYKELRKNDLKKYKPVSRYRRENLRYLRGQPKKVSLQVLIANERSFDKSSVFEVNLDSLSCQRVYLDEQRQLYVICQTQTKNGAKHLIIRSPMQITNNLQIPMEVQLIQTSRHQIVQGELFESNQEARGYVKHEMVIKPEQAVIIPLKACGFEQVKMRPLMLGRDNVLYKDSLYEWTNTVSMSLLQVDREIFEKKPVVMVSKVATNKDMAQRNNNRLFFILNANVYSIRSFIDFNTQ